MASKRANKVFNSIKATPIKMPTETPLGSPGYDNPREDIEKVKKIREGSVEKEPVFENDIVNKHYLDGIINSGLWMAPTLTDEGGLNVSWGIGEVYDHATLSKICTVAGSDTCTDNKVNFLIWPASGTTLTLGTSRADIAAGEIDIGHFHVAAGDIIDGIHAESIICDRESNISDALANMFPIAVTEGIICSEHVGDNAFDIDSSAGVYYHDGHERHTIDAIESITTSIIRHFHTAGALDTDSNSQIDPTKWDNGTNLVATTAGKYYRSTFIIAADSVIHWIYPTEEFANLNAAIIGNDPATPGGLEGFPKSTSLIMKSGDAALPVAGSDQWIDSRTTLTTTTAGSITDHTELASIGTNTHEEIDTHITDFSTGASRVKARVYQTAQFISTGTNTKLINYNLEDYDNLGEYNNSIGRFTATKAGYYHIKASCLFAGTSWPVGTVSHLLIYKNGTAVSIGGRKMQPATLASKFHHLETSDVMHLAANDYIEIYVYQSTGSTKLTATDGRFYYFSVHRLS